MAGPLSSKCLRHLLLAHIVIEAGGAERTDNAPIPAARNGGPGRRKTRTSGTGTEVSAAATLSTMITTSMGLRQAGLEAGAKTCLTATLASTTINASTGTVTAATSAQSGNLPEGAKCYGNNGECAKETRATAPIVTGITANAAASTATGAIRGHRATACKSQFWYCESYP